MNVENFFAVHLSTECAPDPLQYPLRPWVPDTRGTYMYMYIWGMYLYSIYSIHVQYSTVMCVCWCLFSIESVSVEAVQLLL